MTTYAQVLEAWQFTPEITLGLLLLACCYLNGVRRGPRVLERGRPWGWRPWSFLLGLAALYAALQSPLDFLADHFFCIHQVQHLTLMMIGPILLLAPAPAAALTRGLPARLRQWVLVPLARSRTIQMTFGFLTHPITATILGGGMLYLWMTPALYDTALLNERVHNLMHFSMLFSGLLFWWRVLDQRRPPMGTSYLYRAAMLKINLMMVAFLGAFLTAKQSAVYSGNGTFDLLQMTAIADERLGGMVLWLGGCGILVAALTITIRRWIVSTQQSSSVAVHLESGEDARDSAQGEGARHPSPWAQV